MERYVEEAETQYTEWKGTAALDDPQFGVAADVFGIDKERYGVLAFSLYSGGEANVGFVTLRDRLRSRPLAGR